MWINIYILQGQWNFKIQVLCWQQCYWLQQSHPHLYWWRIWAKFRVTFELRDIKSPIKMSREKQRKSNRERHEHKEKFLQETKERIQHQKQGTGWGNYHMVRKLGTGPSFLIPPAVMDYIPEPAFFLHLHFGLFHIREKTDEV